MSTLRPQIVATVGPAVTTREGIGALIDAGAGALRFNLSWGDFDEHRTRITQAREAMSARSVTIPLILDIPGPRIQNPQGHTYNDHDAVFTEHDKQCVAFAATVQPEYIAQSFVGSAIDIHACRDAITTTGGTAKIIAKIERRAALDNLTEIIEAADAVMVARGDLGNEVPIEEIPFVEEDIITRAHRAGKSVIVATQMMLSMVEHDTPTRAEVTDVSYAIRLGADAVMLSEETAHGKFPHEAVAEMARIIETTERHYPSTNVHPL